MQQNFANWYLLKQRPQYPLVDKTSGIVKSKVIMINYLGHSYNQNSFL